MTRVWIVTYPTELSVAEDCYFECDGEGLERQFRGGLKGSDIQGFYNNASIAASVADDLIRERDKRGSGGWNTRSS